jgi:hypothetical protein
MVPMDASYGSDSAPGPSPLSQSASQFDPNHCCGPAGLHIGTQTPMGGVDFDGRLNSMLRHHLVAATIAVLSLLV